MYKSCTGCKLEKPISSFSKDSKSKDGNCFRCKDCMSVQSAAYHAGNKEKIAARKARHELKNPGAQARKALKWRQSHPDKARAGYARYHLENKEKVAAKDAKRYAANPEKAAMQYAKWSALNPSAVKAKDASRRARLKNAPGSHTKDDINSLIDLQKNKCAICKCGIQKKYHVDHIQPLAKGGSNDKANLQILCKDCNLNKHAKDPISFMQSKGFLL